MKHPRRILITGATGAIGSALAIRYAAPGIHLLLQGRRSELLAGLQWQCLERGAAVETVTLDLCDRQELAAWLDQICQAPLPELVILNAGLNTHIGPRGEPEPWAQVEAVMEVNLRASIFIAQRLLPGMLARGYGQLALMSSLAACFGLPVTPAYCATKAGLKAYGQALRGWLSPRGIEVNVILPGYVNSPMCHDMPGPKPFLWSARRAAQYIQHGLARNRASISFPFPLNWGAWWLQILPTALSLRILGWLGYERHGH
ncbi:SDR family NAD(P)-dependent oxidoreductase [Herbaspirillum rubrisubalbicans]|uniref:Short-chain dehydrogenase n=1 Tax=Herbaspirillum rubrisubalbicans TaxID=80842 RepID=A0AAD0UD65_9BURK|nr:SDR family NAD(P)-dependent oxidoreductase [Herbaspirillum rubrisubalbicans]ALU91298.1 short-chain dehydrogenase/reductase protein [Herbaspirillum rubrisubalbicans M1]AYR26322.1 short-chain dehydrogenase [Herbaspirillum rubrisubalbicans]